MNAPLRVGIAGLGRLGKRHAQCIARRLPDATLVAACSPVREELDWARTTLGTEVLHADFDTFVRDPGVDAVVLVTPTPLHAEQTIAALHAGKHVFVEKPLSLDVQACERVEAQARMRPDLVVMVGFVRRFDPSYRQARRDIDAGLVGRPFLIRSQTCDRHDPDGGFVRFAPTSGGIFMDCSVHDIDLARWMLGSPRATRVFASGTIAMHPELADCGDVDNGMAIVEFDNGARAILYASRTMAHGHETTTDVIGTGGMLSIGVGAQRDRVQIRDGAGVRHRAVVDFFERFGEAFQGEMEAFVDACRGGPRELNLADATESTRIGQALARSLHCRQAVSVGPD